MGETVGPVGQGRDIVKAISTSMSPTARFSSFILAAMKCQGSLPQRRDIGAEPLSVVCITNSRSIMTTASPVRVFIVDDHPIIRHEFRRLLEDEGTFVVDGEAGSGAETMQIVPQADVDLAIVDISMKDMDGLELTRRLKEVDPEVQVLIVSMHGETRYVNKALDAGATGYVLKDNVHEVLLDAAHTVSSGEMYLCDEIAGDVDA